MEVPWMKKISRRARIAKSSMGESAAKTIEIQHNRLKDAFVLTDRASSVPTPPSRSQANRISAIINSLPLNRDKNSRMASNCVTTEEIPVAMTTDWIFFINFDSFVKSQFRMDS